MKTIPYGKQTISEEDVKAVIDVLRSDFLTQGPAVKDFEVNFAEFVGSKYAVAVANGTAALHLCALALNVQPGQKVLTSPLTFVATANCIRYCGGDLEFIDIDKNTFNIDLNLLENKLRASPKGTYSGIIPVSFAGLPSDTEKVRKLADEYGLWVIEDACHSPGGEFQDSGDSWVKCGSGKYADLTIFSFHPVKHIASGEGGMITTNDRALYDRILKLRTHGITKDPTEMNQSDGGWYYEMQVLGFNYRMPDILCALGNSQLKVVHSSLNRRREIAAFYDGALKSLPLKLPQTVKGFHHAYHLYVIQVENRKKVYDSLKAQGILCQIHYLPVYQHPYYRELYQNVSCPEAEAYYAHCLSIPMYPSLTQDDLERVVRALKESLGV